MFVCSECVKPEGQWLFMLLLSHGKCEMCGQVSSCADIHDYSVIRDNSEESKNNEE